MSLEVLRFISVQPFEKEKTRKIKAPDPTQKLHPLAAEHLSSEHIPRSLVGS